MNEFERLTEDDIRNIKEINQLIISTNKTEREKGITNIIKIYDEYGYFFSGPFLHHTMPIMLKLIGDKKSNIVRNESKKILAEMFKNSPKLVQLYLIRTFLCNTEDESSGLSAYSKWQTIVSSLELISHTASLNTNILETIMPILVPIVSELMWNTKRQVSEQATRTMNDIAQTITNEDIKPFIPSLIEAITEPENVPECIYDLAGTTFVKSVTASALSLTVPLLERGFKERDTIIRRKCAVITENLAKLVSCPNDVKNFLPVLVPALEKGLQEISDPECRERFVKANTSLQKFTIQQDTVINRSELVKLLQFNILEEKEAYVIDMLNCILQLDIKFNSIDNLNEILQPFLSENKIQDVYKFICNDEDESWVELNIEDDDINEADIICDMKFSLAYGTNILLNDSRLFIVKGHKYGIIANKSAGKTTLLRSISNGQIDGFPSPDEVKTVFIENDIQGAQQKMNVVEFVQDTVNMKNVGEENIRDMLKSIGFTNEMINGPITSLSGGWKMKLALGRATLQKADIMLMDEPTNHLDVVNVQWVVDYINSLPDVTCLIVSHDTAFLDKTVTDIIHFENLQLHTYKGNVSVFVKNKPEAKSYFELSSSSLSFKFPTPTILQSGSKSNRGRTLLEMKNVSFTYPSATKPQLNNVNVKASMASRVAIVGANGAGKSTMIKLLTGELKPCSGEVKKHPNCRFAYVAQHAFHHIEQHLDKSPNKYICWRYESGEDKEEDHKASVEISEEEQKKMDEPWNVSWKDSNTGEMRREKRIVEKILSRRKSKKTFEYEVRWKNKSMDFNMWFPRNTLCNKGFTKMLTAVDTRLAAIESMNHRPLTHKNVTEHLAAVGLETEFANHSRIRDLSGGQKVKVVLAACTWACPHLIILDEPTNYLDRDSLGALARAIKEFEGGVVLITHNKEFADATTRETWVVANNICDVKGDPEWEKYAAEQQVVKEISDDTTDAYGNKIIKKGNKKKISEMSRKEIKQNKKKLKEKIKNCEELETYELEWAAEWNLL